MKYCERCVLPDTRPGVKLDDDGVCAGCRNAVRKASIDWAEREAHFRTLCADAKSRAQSYDCVIPVSGGKDSFWQVVTCLEHGLHPLCVTYAYPGRTALGLQNLRSLLELGVDHLELRLNPKVERALVKKAFLKTGISGLVTHMAIYNYPLQVALAHHIPLVVYGENSAFEYGSDDESLVGARVDQAWLKRFGVTAGTTAADWVDDEISAKDLSALYAPEAIRIAQSGIRAVFLGYYFPWDSHHSRSIAMAHGFCGRTKGPRVGHYDFVNIDDDMIGVHHHPKWHKFGLTRTWDTLSMEIRSGRLTRADALDRIRKTSDETPWDDITLFCEHVGLSQRQYFEVLEDVRNPAIWHRQNGRWVMPEFLIDDFEWPEDPKVEL